MDYVRRKSHRGIEVVGEEGVLRWDFEPNRLEVYSAATREWRVEPGEAAVERNQMYVEELRHFVACVCGEVESEPLADGEQGAAVLAIALAALRSSREGRAVDFRTEDEVVRGWLRRLGGAQANS